MKLPDPYDGSGDLRAFQKYAICPANYAHVNGYSDEAMLKMMFPFVNGKADVFYLDYVANCVNDWSLERTI